MSSKRIVNFVYSEPTWGSTVLRIFQLGQTVEHFLGDVLDVRYTQFPARARPLNQWVWAKRQPRGSIFFLNKPCFERISEDTLDILRNKGGSILFDLVDVDLRNVPKSGCDRYVCTSYSQLRAVQRRVDEAKMGPGAAFLFLHNPDSRLFDLPLRPSTELRTIYVGLAKNLAFRDIVEGQVEIFDLVGDHTFERALSVLPDYNFHYCLRPKQEEGAEIYKPFTKGITAAVCGANVLVHRDADDAEVLLGADYPYLVDQYDAGHVAEVLARAEQGFGGCEWKAATDVMESIAAKVTPQLTAQRFKELVNGVR